MSLPRELTREEKEILSSNPQLFIVERIGSNPNKAGSKIHWTEEQINFIKEDYNTNMDVKRLSLLFGTSEQAMREWLHKFGIKTLLANEKKRVKKTYNSDYFEKINTPDKAYWLGFLYADGGIIANKRWAVRINLKAEDIDHLEKFLKAIEYTEGKIRETVKKDNGKEYKGAYINISDKKMVQDLIDKGCTPKKSYTISFPTENQVPNNLLSHFIRGYFDGDGCITSSNHKNSTLRYYGGNVIGTKSMLQGILKAIGKDYLKINPLSKIRDSVFTVSFSGNRMMSQLADYLYKDSNEDILLSRKKKKFDELKKQRREVKTYSNKNEYGVA